MVTTFEKFQFTENPMPGGRLSTFEYEGLLFMVFEVAYGDPFFPDDPNHRPKRGCTKVTIETYHGSLDDGFKTEQEFYRDVFHAADPLVLKKYILKSHIKKRNDHQLLSQEQD